MYMAFVIHEENEDLVSFYVRKSNGEYKIYSEYITRGDTSMLNSYIKCYMFEKKENQNINTNEAST